MYICPNCASEGTVKEETCRICMGWGVVISLYTNCPHCKFGCLACGGQGYVLAPVPFTKGSHRYDAALVREALQVHRVGYAFEDAYPEPALLGLVSVLFILAGERTGDAVGDGESWLKTLLDESDALVIEPSGIWSERKKRGIRVYDFPLSPR
jgi:hypothetical protein